MEPENAPLEKEKHLPTTNSWIPAAGFRVCHLVYQLRMQPEPEPLEALPVSEVTVGAKVVTGTPVEEGEGDGSTPVLISVEPPAGSSRTASDICCVVDVSGSMSNDALLQGEDGSMSTSHGLSVLDIVKHALRTIIANLNDSDRLACVSYSNSAREIFPLMSMEPNGRTLSEGKLDELQADGMTNLWDGLQTGLQVLKNGQDAGGGGGGRMQHILLFTDGMPNINPPRGILPMLKRLKEKSEGGILPCTISTFGFGYELDSALLSDLAMEGFGTYAFIPDAGFVGTVFVNAMSNLLATMARDVRVTLKSTSRMAVLGGHQTSQTEVMVNLGTLQFGQTRDLVVMLEGPGEVEAVLEYCTPTGPFRSTVAQGGGSMPLRVEAQRLRLKAVDSIQEAMTALKLTAMDRASGKALPLEAADRIIKAMVQEIRGSPAQDAEAMKGLLEDLEGQVTEALSREDWYKKWGMHYLPSLMFAHRTQQCNNFKDAGVQAYGGDLFQSLRDKADDIFLSLPAPQPTARARPTEIQHRSVPVSRPVAAPISMAAFYDASGG